MTNASFVKTTYSSLLIVLLGIFSSQAADRPNVLLILADDLGIGGLHCYGTDYLETPNIDRLANEGMKFTNGLAAFPTCKPSRAALLTGQYSPRTGVYRVVDRHTGQEDKIRFLLPPNEDVSTDKILISEPFQKAGYATAAYGKWHIGNPQKDHPTEYGFDDAIESHGGHFNAKTIPEIDLPDGTLIEEVLTTRAIEFIENAAKKDQPFFVYMPYFLVHAPMEAHEADIKYFEKKLEGIDFAGKHVRRMPVLAAMTRELDKQVGRLLGTIESLDLEEDTIIIFASDNGAYDENLVGDFRGQKGQVYEGGMRVPYIFKWQNRIAANSVDANRIISVDLYPTLLTLAGIDSPKNYPIDGYDLSSLLLGRTRKLPIRSIFCYFPKYARYSDKTQRWGDSWRNVIYHGDYKLIDYPEYNDTELFDLSSDPREMKDLAKSLPEKRKELNRLLDDWLKTIEAPELTPNQNFSL
ncbi:MAG: sulfatase [Opitutales bacterium]|jgi:arylsulfatase A-like enzyme|nr:sulfatase [Opitutales bacterium]MBT5815726.1 sulfatase [Opitutales bacterium]MBT6381753.1 sulfatase [Opitutales bacterium]MBT6768030.1 sulfatase [Opitutales bacterium]MBT7867638.1 sulfatase [Opitutales bacterium]